MILGFGAVIVYCRLVEQADMVLGQVGDLLASRFELLEGVFTAEES